MSNQILCCRSKCHRLFVFPIVTSLLLLFSFQTARGYQDDDPRGLSGFDSGEVFDVSDDQVFQPDNEFLIRLLFRASKASRNSFLRYADFTRSSELAQVVEDSQRFRFHVFRIQGRAKRVTPVRIPGMEDDVEFRGCYLVHVETDDQHSIMVALPGSEQVPVAGLKPKRLPPVPLAWPNRENIDEPCFFEGFYLARHTFPNQADIQNAISADKLGLKNEIAMLFVAKRLAWHPDKENSQFGVGHDQLLLSEHGVDIGQLDYVRANSNRAISKKEASIFYQLLKATHEMSPDSIEDSKVGFQHLLRDPGKHYGDSISIDGFVRRVVKIKIDDVEQIKRLGFSHYYELDMFVPLGDSLVVIRSRSDRENSSQANTKSEPRTEPSSPDSSPEQLVYEDRFPLTVCVSRLPGDPETLEKKRVLVKGFVFKLWNFESRFTEQFNSQTGQICPLIIGLEPQVTASSKGQFKWLLIGFAVLLLAFVGFYFGILARDRPAPTLIEKPEKVDLSGIE